MIPKYLLAAWDSIAPALGDHLWQSTLFAAAAGLLTLLLREQHARARYWLWLAASVKFLIPFSLLVSMGSHLAWSRGSAVLASGLYFTMEEISQPFTQPWAPVVSRSTPAIVQPAIQNASLLYWLPVLAAVWVCGFVAVLFIWWMRWARISSVIRQSIPLREGREVEALRRLEHVGGQRKRTEILLSRSSLEPGIFGITRPVLVWPDGISEHLSNAHLEAILVHELRHVRRRDNLAATIHMVVEALFWFHPLVWWLGARLVDERERACDEEVLALGTERQVYAESILRVCKFCVGSPLACVSGVTGADLKKRMVHIMTVSVLRKLDLTRKLLLSATGVAAIALPIVYGLGHATPSQAQARTEEASTPALVFAETSVKADRSGSGRVKLMFSQDGLSASNVTLQMLVREAYGVQDKQIIGAPDWLNSEKYSVEAKLDKTAQDQLGNLEEDHTHKGPQRILQALLADNFKLAVHRETQDLPVYALVIAPSGAKFHESRRDDAEPNGHKEHRMLKIAGRGQLVADGVPMEILVRMLSEQVGGTVVDKTGLTGNYDFTLQWRPDPSVDGHAQIFKETGGGTEGTADTAATSKSTIFKALQDQLGLKLESQNGPVETLIVDHVERPAQNQ